jgi:hypothetical protein
MEADQRSPTSGHDEAARRSFEILAAYTYFVLLSDGPLPTYTLGYLMMGHDPGRFTDEALAPPGHSTAASPR